MILIKTNDSGRVTHLRYSDRDIPEQSDWIALDRESPPEQPSTSDGEVARLYYENDSLVYRTETKEPSENKKKIRDAVQGNNTREAVEAIAREMGIPLKGSNNGNSGNK